MTIPSLTIQYAGQNQVSADQFNTYQQICNIVTDLRGFVGISGMKVFMGGYTSNGDGGQGVFYWNASGVATDDSGVTCITPSGAASGQWTRLTGGSTVSSNSPVFPMGRLTLATGAPVMTADATAQTTLYYAPYLGSLLPIHNGTGFISYAFSQVSLALDNNSGHTGYQQSGKLFDVFGFINNSAVAIGTGPAWSTSLARGTGAGTTQLTMLNGIWTNTVSISLKPDATSTRVTVAIGQGTYLGTIYATANGQTAVMFKPSAASGGGGNIIGIWNAYNRVPIHPISRDSSSGYTYGTNAWQKANNDANNRISWVDGLQQVSPTARLKIVAGTAVAGDLAQIGVNLDSTSATPNLIGTGCSATGTLADNYQPINLEESFTPQLGFHFIQAMENSPNGVTATFNLAGTSQSLIVDMEY